MCVRCDMREKMRVEIVNVAKMIDKADMAQMLGEPEKVSTFKEEAQASLDRAFEVISESPSIHEDISILICGLGKLKTDGVMKPDG